MKKNRKFFVMRRSRIIQLWEIACDLTGRKDLTRRVPAEILHEFLDIVTEELHYDEMSELYALERKDQEYKARKKCGTLGVDPVYPEFGGTEF